MVEPLVQDIDLSACADIVALPCSNVETISCDQQAASTSSETVHLSAPDVDNDDLSMDATESEFAMPCAASVDGSSPADDVVSYIIDELLVQSTSIG